MQDNFEKNIKSRLLKHEISPPSGAWEKISKTLKEEKPKTLPGKKRAGIAAAVLLAALFTIGILWLNPSSNKWVDSKKMVISKSVKEIESPGVRSPSDNPGNPGGKTLQSGETLSKVKDVIQTGDSDLSIDNSSLRENRSMKFFQSLFGEEQQQRNSETSEVYGTDSAFKNSAKVHVISILTTPSNSNYSSEINPPDFLGYYYNPKEFTNSEITLFNKDETKVIEVNNKKLKISGFEFNPFAGTALVGSFKQPSLIAPEFNKLDIESEMATTYGSRAAYMLNNKLKIRTGVGMINITQKTYNVPFSISNEAGTVRFNMIGYSNVSPDLSEINEYQTSFSDAETSNITQLQYNLEHNLQLIEVPLEMEYKVTNGRQLNLAATGGISTLFLNKNEVYAENTNTLIAKPANVKSTSFSANAGVKMDYKVTEKISVNVEPQLKYMINTITGNDDIQPYLLGINAGVSFGL